MNRRVKLSHQFVEFLPDKLTEHVVYVAIKYNAVAHKCVCGCGNEVNTPLSPTGWSLTFDGISVSLYPSIGNWGFPCQSHYWIERDHVKWAGRWTQEEINEGRNRDSSAREIFYGSVNTPAAGIESETVKGNASSPSQPTFWQWLKNIIGR